MISEERFNKIFSAFVLIGMSIALVLTTAFKMSTADAGMALLLVSAFGSLMGVLSTVASANGHIITFLFGLLDVSIYGIVCFINWSKGGSGLGNALLHAVYFVPMQFVGFAQWRKRGASGTGQVKARRMDARQWLICTVGMLLFSVCAYLVIAHFDKSSAETFIKTAVVLDVIPLMCNILGQYLMSTAYMEQWIFWIGVNISSIIMWSVALRDPDKSYAAIYLVKYSFYLINSINGLRIWWRLSRTRE